MPVTDLTDSLPWWAQQGGGGGGQQPSGGGNSAGWLQYLSQMYGISPQQAATMMQSGGNPADMPSADASNMMADAPVVRPGPGAANPPFQLPGATPALPAGTTMPPVQSQPQNLGRDAVVNRMSGMDPVDNPPQPYGGPMAAADASRPFPPRPVYDVGASGAGSGDPRGPDAAMNQMTGMAPGVVNPGYRPPGITPGPVNPNAPAANAQPVSGPLAAGGAGGMGAASNPRFVSIARPNAPAGGSPYGRGGGAQMSALNLAGLFGGGPQGGPAAAPMGGGPVPGPLANARPDLAQRVPLANAPMPPVMPPDIAAARAQQLNPAVARARMLQPNYYS